MSVTYGCLISLVLRVDSGALTAQQLIPLEVLRQKQIHKYRLLYSHWKILTCRHIIHLIQFSITRIECLQRNVSHS